MKHRATRSPSHLHSSLKVCMFLSSALNVTQDQRRGQVTDSFESLIIVSSLASHV